MFDAPADLYQIVIDDHRRRPRNRGPLPAANRVSRRENPACGDFCTIELRLDPANGPDARIAAAAFTGAGCALSQASASLATAALTGRTLPEARNLVARVETLVGVGAPEPGDEADPTAAPRSDYALGDLVALSAAHAFPARHACALLAWRAALDAVGAG